jgi:catechol 2,3-dioxygenase-like lactoylglutathione lyase family enzyme
MSVEGLLQIHITVSDLARAVSFYRDILGIDFLFEVPDQSMAFLDLNGVRLYLGIAESAEFESAPLLYLSVADIDAEHQRMSGLGVEFISTPHIVHHAEAYDLWMADFKTPEGHIHVLAEERPLN